MDYSILGREKFLRNSGRREIPVTVTLVRRVHGYGTLSLVTSEKMRIAWGIRFVASSLYIFVALQLASLLSIALE